MNNLIDLSNGKEEIRHHLRLFLSCNDDFVVLPDQLRQATPINFIPPADGQPLAPLPSYQHSAAILPTLEYD
jgi:hypothetical protein